MNGVTHAQLVEERERLKAQKLNIDQRLEAIENLIGLYSNALEMSRGDMAHNVKPSGKVNLRQECLRFVGQMGNRWFRTRDILEMIFESNLRARKESEQVRPLVSGYLTQFWSKGMLERENVGKGKRAEYRYKQKNSITG